MKQQLVERRLPDPAHTGPEAGRPRRSVTMNLAESPLTWLHARGHLSDRQLAAGERLRADWERAQLAPRTTMRWDPVRITEKSGGRLDPTERQMAAKDRFHGAIAAAGPGLSDILWRIACAGEGMPLAEKALGWPARSGKLVLGFALDRVAGFYGIG